MQLLPSSKNGFVATRLQASTLQPSFQLYQCVVVDVGMMKFGA